MPPLSSATIQQQFLQLLADRGIVSSEGVRETLLIRDGFFCGRKFSMEGFSLVWFIEEDQIKLFDRDNQLILSTTTSLFLGVEQRRAA
jgi:hypothetical protein